MTGGPVSLDRSEGGRIALSKCLAGESDYGNRERSGEKDGRQTFDQSPAAGPLKNGAVWPGHQDKGTWHGMWQKGLGQSFADVGCLNILGAADSMATAIQREQAVQMGGSPSKQRNFCKAVGELFGKSCLRKQGFADDKATGCLKEKRQSSTQKPRKCRSREEMQDYRIEPWNIYLGLTKRLIRRKTREAATTSMLADQAFMPITNREAGASSVRNDGALSVCG